MQLQTFRNTTFVSYFWGFMAMYFLNICVDASDIHHNAIPEDLSYNEQESIIELVVEKVFDLGDIFQEQDDEDPEDYGKKGVAKIDLSLPNNDLSTVRFGSFPHLAKNFELHYPFF